MSYGSYREHETNWFQRNGYELFVVGAGLAGLILGLVIGGLLGAKVFCHCPKASAPAVVVAARVTATSTPTLTRTTTGTATLTATATAISKVTVTSVAKTVETPTTVRPTVPVAPSPTKPIPTKTTAVEEPWLKYPEAKSGRYWVTSFDWLLYKEGGVILLTGYFVPSDDNGKRRDDLKVRQTVWLKLHGSVGPCVVKLESIYDFLAKHSQEELVVDYAFDETFITAGEDQWSCLQKIL